jgi:hypothetical protein
LQENEWWIAFGPVFIYFTKPINPVPMKRVKIIAYTFLVFPFYCLSQGSTCSNAIALSLDDVCRNYTTSSSTGANVLCTGSSSTITWFTFTTNSVPQDVQMNITDPSGQPVEIAMYTACNGGGSSPLLTSSMCFDDGKGIWAPYEGYSLLANTTYMLRIKTSGATTLSICAKNNTPQNDDCNGATLMSTGPISDNNANHKGGPGVWPSDVCANTLENTAFYYYYVLNTGTTAINISSIECDNGSGNNYQGFQVGFFTGTCGSLVPLSCDSGSVSFTQAATGVLPAGTRVTVAIDGYAGSNCKYTLEGINIYVLPTADVRKFTVQKSTTSNVLSWDLNYEHNFKNVEIQRSADNRSFSTIGYLSVSANESNTHFSFADEQPLNIASYRLVFFDINGKKEVSQVILVKRGKLKNFDVRFANTVTSALALKIETEEKGRCDLFITGLNGQVYLKSQLFCIQGVNSFTKDVYALPSGKYFVTLKQNNKVLTKPFYKIR